MSSHGDQTLCLFASVFKDPSHWKLYFELEHESIRTALADAAVSETFIRWASNPHRFSTNCTALHSPGGS